jgi:hypothetical protein
MKRKPNSIRAMRTLRKENRELKNRLMGAQRERTRRRLLERIPLDARTQDYVRCATKLGYTCEVFLDAADGAVLVAVEYVGA